jgi:hypothetical protein
MLQVFHEQAQAEAIPASAGGPRVRAGREAGPGGPPTACEREMERRGRAV